MPLMNLSSVLFDPRLADRFTVNRRAETVNGSGIATVALTVLGPFIGVVTAQSAGELIRMDDAQTSPRKISIVCKFQLRRASPGFQPDEVVFNGNIFTIVEVLPYDRFGPGFCTAIAQYLGTMPQPT